MQVHVSRYLKYNIEKKTYTDHRAIFRNVSRSFPNVFLSFKWKVTTRDYFGI